MYSDVCINVFSKHGSNSLVSIPKRMIISEHGPIVIEIAIAVAV